MKTTTTLRAAVATSAVSRVFASTTCRPSTLGMSSMAAIGDLGQSWSLTTNAHVIRQAAKAHKAYGTRRLGETST